jgi:hypothetical protein
MKHKKAVEMSLTTIVIAAISLLILVILVILVSNSGTEISKGTKCITQGGVCQENTCETGKGVTGTNLCTSGHCCRPI